MLPKFVFEAYFLLLSYYPKRVSKEIGNIFNWKTTHCPWVKLLLNSLSSPFYFYGGTFLPPQLMAMAFYQYINPCNFSKSLQILSNFQRIKYIATGRLDKVFLAYATPNKTIVIGISLSNRICPHESNASIYFWLKTTSQVDVIAPSIVWTIQNVKLLPCPKLCHSLMLCRVTRSQRMGGVKHFGDPPVLVEPSRLRRNRRSCRKWIRRDAH